MIYILLIIISGVLWVASALTGAYLDTTGKMKDPALFYIFGTIPALFWGITVGICLTK